MTAIELMYAMAKRARELSNENLPTLRYAVGTANTYHGAQAENRHKSRGELVEEILARVFAVSMPGWIT